MGLISSSERTRCNSHQAKNCPTPSAYAARVFLFLIVATKNSMKRHAAASPARPIAAGSRSIPARARSRGGIGTSSALMNVVHQILDDGTRILRDQKSLRDRYHHLRPPGPIE